MKPIHFNSKSCQGGGQNLITIIWSAPTPLCPWPHQSQTLSPKCRRLPLLSIASYKALSVHSHQGLNEISNPKRANHQQELILKHHQFFPFILLHQFELRKTEELLAMAKREKKLQSSSFTYRCRLLVSERRARFYILRRCIMMLICWNESEDVWQHKTSSYYT